MQNETQQVELGSLTVKSAAVQLKGKLECRGRFQKLQCLQIIKKHGPTPLDADVQSVVIP